MRTYLHPVLSESLVEKAEILGNGNLSEGIRVALENGKNLEPVEAEYQVHFYLSDDLIQVAYRLGHGNMSKGVRHALEKIKTPG